MTINSKLREEIVRELSQIPRLQNRRGRHALVISSGLKELESTIDWEGSTRDFVSHLVDQLDYYGVVSDGQNALVALLKRLENEAGIDHREKYKYFCRQVLFDNALQVISPGTDRTWKVFVSSTFSDLQEFHEAVHYEIKKHDQLEYFGGRPNENAPMKLEILDCDLFVGIYAQKYGEIYEDDKSIIELEYDIALEAEKSIVCFMLSDDAYWKVSLFDTGEAAKRLQAFKTRIIQEQNIREFKNAKELISLVRETLVELTHSEAIDHSYLHNLELQEVEGLYKRKIARVYNQFPTLFPGRRLRFSENYTPLLLKQWPVSIDRSEPQKLEAVLKEVRRFIVLGLPGTGKTTLLRYLAFVQSAYPEGSIPVYVRLAHFSMTDDKLAHYIMKEIKQHIGKQAAKRLLESETFCDSRYLILLDGLDEVDQADYDNVVRKIHSFVAEYRSCKLVITSRLTSFEVTSFKNWKFYSVNPLSQGDISRFISNWFRDSDFNYDPLIKTLQTRQRLADLARVPFLLVMICHVYESDKMIYNVRSQLYQKSIEYLLGVSDWDPDRQGTHIHQEENFLKIVKLLKNIAFHFYRLGQKEFSREELQLLIAKEYSDSAIIHQFIFDLVDSGILQSSGESYFFMHRTIWEYFTALALVDRVLKGEIIEEISVRAKNPYWEEPLRLCVGLLSDNEKVESYIETLWRYNKQLALRSTIELEAPPTKLLSQLINEVDKDERLLIISTLAAPNNLTSEQERRLAIETIDVLFSVETDCEVIFKCIELLRRIDPDDRSGLIGRKLDIDNSKQRLTKYLSDPQYLLDFIEVEGGTFQMGNPNPDRDNDKPIHPVRVSTFYMSKYMVTSRLYLEFPFLNEAYREHYESNLNKPVSRVTWFEAVLFSIWLGCRLPTEAEWEYACRASTQTRYFFGDTPDLLDSYGWYYENSQLKTHPVGEKLPNPNGLFDIVGNVWEMCKDYYDERYYDLCIKDGMAVNPQGPTHGEYVVHRGGSYRDNPGKLCSGYRSNNSPKIRSMGVGFRLCYQGNLDGLQE